jgi:uncharacterized LabA/DUF88 family protein
MCRRHLKKLQRRSSQLYRIFYYDCPPLANKAQNPITKQPIDLSRTPTALWRLQFHAELRRMRKIALRLGYLNDRSANWILRPDVLSKLLSRQIQVDDITGEDLRYHAQQKGVDMRIGLDIASLAYKRLVDQIVLVAGDSDFVPAAKLARREGIDVILDPMWANIRDDLHEHVDGLWSILPRPQMDSSRDAHGPGTP